AVCTCVLRCGVTTVAAALCRRLLLHVQLVGVWVGTTLHTAIHRMVVPVVIVRALRHSRSLAIVLLPSDYVRCARALSLGRWRRRAARGEGGKSKCERDPRATCDHAHRQIPFRAHL